MELWDLYNERRELIGRDHIRGEEVPRGYYHLVVHIWIRNKKGEYLISQRSADRPTFPLMWECTGGSVVKGEIAWPERCGKHRKKLDWLFPRIMAS